MAKNGNDFTLDDISILLDKKFGEFRLEVNDRFREVDIRLDNFAIQTDGQFRGIEDRLDAQSDRMRKLERGVAGLRSLVYQKIDSLKVEMNDRFEDADNRVEEVLEKIQDFIGITDKSEDKKIKELKNALEPRIEKLEHKFKFNQI